MRKNIQLTELNRSIPQKNRRIKAILPGIKRVRVTFQVQVYTPDKSDLVYQSDDLSLARAKRVWNEIVNDVRYPDHIHQLVRIQSAGYVGGIILGGSREVVDQMIV